MVEIVDKSEIKNVINFLDKKIEWLKLHNKNQWQSLDYTGIYNYEYFCNCLNNGDILLIDKENDKILGCLLLKSNGHYMNEYEYNDNVLYILHFASISLKSGRRLLNYCVKIAKEKEVDYLRGDANAEYGHLVDYYTMFGAKVVKELWSDYHCFLLEYKISNK